MHQTWSGLLDNPLTARDKYIVSTDAMRMLSRARTRMTSELLDYDMHKKRSGLLDNALYTRDKAHAGDCILENLHLTVGHAQECAERQYAGTVHAMHKTVPYLLDNASNARDCANAGALKFGHLQLAVEHAANKRCVLVNLERRSFQLQLLHDTHRRIQI